MLRRKRVGFQAAARCPLLARQIVQDVVRRRTRVARAARDFLEELRELHERIENEIPLVVEVTSLVNARETRGVGDELVVGELMEDWPEDEAAIRDIEARARANAFYQNNLISGDGQMTAIQVELESYSQLGQQDDALDGFGDDAFAADDPGAEPPPFLTGPEEHEVVAAGHKGAADLAAEIAADGDVLQVGFS